VSWVVTRWIDSTRAQTEVEIRSLAAYDTALGIATGAEGRMA
jgi:hypothetical protein